MSHYHAYSKGASRAGLRVRLKPDEETEPVDFTLYVKSPEKDVNVPDDAIGIIAGGNVTLSLGKKGYVTFFAEGSQTLDDAPPEPRGEI
jgi:hypothetical protein